MKSLPQSWPFPDSVIPVGCGEDQRAATSGSYPVKRTQGVDVLERLATGHRRPPKPRTAKLDVSTFDAHF